MIHKSISVVRKPLPLYKLLLFLACMIFTGCHDEATRPAVVVKGCTGCHSMKLDGNHKFSCSSCHRGDVNAGEKALAHTGLIAEPAHPEMMAKTCGSCHPNQVKEIPQSLHFTLKQEVNLVRRAFGANADLQSLTEIPVAESPKDILGLADDLLRRRCLRCHLYFKGDDYPAVTHGTGCAACHLSFQDGKLASHAFLAHPGDRQCLSCHYGNTVGFDYYGRFEHDLNEEYRTPYTTKQEQFRPYGVEYHELAADIHQQRGLSCTDCHSGNELMTNNPEIFRPSCAGCHDAEELKKRLPKRVKVAGKGYIFLAGPEKKEHLLPLMAHPAHKTTSEKVSCQVCHAQWTFNDSGKHFLRSDSADFEAWDRLITQGSSEVSGILANNTDPAREELPAMMTDKILFKKQIGLWYKGFGVRRWETILLGRDQDGVITTVRPLLDYSLSWIDSEEQVHFDARASQASGNGVYPYTPHTTGKAGLFYMQRLRDFRLSEKVQKD